jgi:hypothetical protein
MQNLSVKSHHHAYLNYEGGDFMFPDGFLEILQALALGIDVRYNSMVKNITWSGDHVKLFVEDGTDHGGRGLLLT